MPTPEEMKAAEEAKAAEAAKAAAGQAGEKKDMVPVGALVDERNKRQSMEARIKQLEGMFGDQITYDAAGNLVPRTTPHPGTPAPQAPNPQIDQRRQLDELWERDPRRAVQAEMNMAFGWYDQVSTQIEDQMDTVAETHKDFGQYRSKVRQYLRALPIEQRMKPGIAEAAYFLQKGKEVDSVIAREREEWNRRIQAGESIQNIPVGGGGEPTGGSTQKFTEDQVKIAAMYNMKPEEYFKK